MTTEPTGAPALAGVPGGRPRSERVRFIDLRSHHTPLIRLTALATWAAETVPNYFRKPAVDGIRVGRGAPAGQAEPGHALSPGMR